MSTPQASLMPASYTRSMTTADGLPLGTLPEDTPLEGFRRLVPVEMRRHMPRIRYCILDTNVLLNNLAYDVRVYPRPTALRLLVALGVLRPYVGPHVVGEVEQHLDGYMLERRLDVARARSIWEDAYLPRLWVADPGPLWSQDRRVADLADRDADDLPTARLAILLGQRALSEDTDLTDYGLASGEPWLQLVLAAGSVAKGETLDFGVGFGASVSMQTAADVIQAGRQFAATPRGKQTLVVIGAAVVVLVLVVLVLRQVHEPSREWIDRKARLSVHALASGGRIAVGGYATVTLDRRRGEVTLRAGVTAEANSPSPIQVAARTLAAVEAPMSTRDLAAAVWSYERVPRAALQRLRSVLGRVPAFVEVAPDRWQLGRRARP